ncbi:MAG: hypothetical protein ACFB15_25895 [Cyclobacteriaceae bacterium]
MKILVACEESQAVTIAFRNKGHEAYSCDLQECSGGYPEWHIQGDALQEAYSGKYDMMIAHPPCQYLTVTANRVFLGNPERWRKRLEAIQFVWQLYNAPIERIAIENPVGVISTHIRKPNQYIQPYHFGDPVSKKTGLWLKSLPPLTHTNNVYDKVDWYVPPSGKRMSRFMADSASTNNPENAKLRSKTFPGIANAMANQWG